MEAPQRVTLKEKWREHWEKKPFQTKCVEQQANWAGMVSYWVCSIAVLYVALKTTISGYFKCSWDYEDDNHKLAAWIIFIECGLNWLVCTFWRSSNIVPPQAQKQGDGWTECPLCQNAVPPRGRHCKICNVCVLKRDHHCFVTGN